MLVLFWYYYIIVLYASTVLVLLYYIITTLQPFRLGGPKLGACCGQGDMPWTSLSGSPWWWSSRDWSWTPQGSWWWSPGDWWWPPQGGWSWNPAPSASASSGGVGDVVPTPHGGVGDVVPTPPARKRCKVVVAGRPACQPGDFVYSSWPVQVPAYPDAGQPLSFDAMRAWVASVGCSVSIKGRVTSARKGRTPSITIKGPDAAKVYYEVYRWTLRAVPRVRPEFRRIALPLVRDLEEADEEQQEQEPQQAAEEAP